MSRENQLISAKYILFGSAKYWILTNHGIYTDFLTKTGHNSDINAQNIDIIFDFHNMNIKEHANPNNSRDKKAINEFKSDWKDLLLGKSIKKDVIFLTKNPKNRFIRGIIDEKLKDLDNNINIDGQGVLNNIFFRKSIGKHFGKELSNEFFNWGHNKSLIRLFQESQPVPLKFKNILEQIIFDLILPTLKNDNIQQRINLYYESNYTYQNLYFLHHMLFNPPTNAIKEKVSVVDVDRENLLKLLNIKYGMDLHFEKDLDDTILPYLIILNKFCDTNLFRDIDIDLETDIKLWKSLSKKQYPPETYNTTSMNPWVNTMEEYYEHIDHGSGPNFQTRVNNHYTDNNEKS